MRISDWSSDVCSSDLEQAKRARPQMPKHVEFGQLADAHSRNAGVDDRMAAIAAKPARWLVEHLSVALLELPGRARADDMLVAIKILNRVERRSEEHTSELQSLMRISYSVFCSNKKTHIVT